MALVEKLGEIKTQTDLLLDFANQTTGAADTRLGDAIKTLCDGFGASSGGFVIKTGSVTSNGVGYALNIRHDIGVIPLVFVLEPDIIAEFSTNRLTAASWIKDGASICWRYGVNGIYNGGVNGRASLIISDTENTSAGCACSPNFFKYNGTAMLHSGTYKWYAIYKEG